MKIRPPGLHESLKDKTHLFRRFTRSAEGAATMGLTCLYFAVMGGHLSSIDGLEMYHQALSLAYAHSLRLAPPIVWGGKITTSKYGLGLSLLYLPGLLLCSWLAPYVPQSGANVYNWQMFSRDPLYTIACAPVQVLIAVASAFLVALLLRELGFARRVVLWGLVLYGVGSPAIVYARVDWAQPLEGLCWIAGVFGAVCFRHRGDRRSLWVAALALGYAVLTRPVEGSLLFIALFVIAAPGHGALHRSRDFRYAASLMAAAFLCALAVTLLVNWGRYGSPFTSGYEGEGWTASLRVSLPAVLVSPGWGIIWEFPAIVLVPLGVVQLRRTGHGRNALVMAGMVGAQLLNTAGWYAWAGGWNWGLRLFLPALPIAAVLAAAGLEALLGRSQTALPTLLLIAGVIWAIPCILTNLLSGYAGMVASGPIYDLRDYPPVGAWQFIHRWTDLDILWVNFSSSTGGASLLPGAFLLVAAIAFTARAGRLKE